MTKANIYYTTDCQYAELDAIRFANERAKREAGEILVWRAVPAYGVSLMTYYVRSESEGAPAPKTRGHAWAVAPMIVYRVGGKIGREQVGPDVLSTTYKHYGPNGVKVCTVAEKA